MPGTSREGVIDYPVERVEENDEDGDHAPRASSRRLAEDARSTTSSIAPDGGLWGWLRVLAAFLLLMTSWGPVQAFGTFQDYYSNTLLSNKSTSDISWIGSVSTLLLITSGAFAGPLFDRGYIKPMMVLGCFLLVFGIMMLSLSTTYTQIFLSQGVCYGLGAGLVYIPGLAFVVNSFQKHRAIAVGITSTGTSVGGVIFPIIFRQLQPKIGFPWTCRVFAFVQLFASLVALTILMSAPVRKIKPRQLFELDAFGSLPFCLFLVASFCSFLAFWIPLFYIPSYAVSVFGSTQDLGSYLTVIVNGASAFGRLSAAVMIQKVGAGLTTSVCTGLAAVLLFIWIGVTSQAGFIVWCVFFGLFTGVLVSGFPMLASHPIIAPDMKAYGTRIGMIYFAGGIGALVGDPIAGVLAHPERRNYVAAQAFAAAIMTICAFMLGTITFLMKRHDNQQRLAEEKDNEVEIASSSDHPSTSPLR